MTEWTGGAENDYYHGAAGSSQNDYDNYESYIVEDEEGWPCCSSCQHYMIDDENEDNDTDTDEEESQAATEMSQPELQQYLGDMSNTTYDGLKPEYLWAKRRFREFAGKSSRKPRFPRKSWSMSMSSGKGRRKGGRPKRQKRLSLRTLSDKSFLLSRWQK